MKKGWYGFNKVLMGLSMAGGFILVIAATYFSGKMFESNRDLEFVPVIICIGGILIVLGYHSLWGLLVETAGNVISLYNQNKYAARMMPQSAPGNMTSMPVQVAGAYSGNAGYAAPAGVVSMPDQYADQGWMCSACGNINSMECKFCQECGAPQNAVPAAAAPVNEFSAPVNMQSAPVNMQPAPVNVPSAPVNVQPSPVPAASESTTFVPPAESDWICAACGCSNRDQASFCRKCGNKRS